MQLPSGLGRTRSVPPPGISQLYPWPSCYTSYDPISAKLPKPACITKTRQTDPGGVTSLHCPQIFPSFVRQPNPKAARAALPCPAEPHRRKQQLKEPSPMAVSSSATGKAAGKGYIPLLGDPVPPRGSATSAATIAGGQISSPAGREKINRSQIKPQYCSLFPPKTTERKLGQRWNQCPERDVPL